MNPLNMNPLNYGSIEACQRLAVAGIALETEMFWNHATTFDAGNELDNGCEITSTKRQNSLPAPSMAEVWRALPVTCRQDGKAYHLMLKKAGLDGSAIASYAGDEETLTWGRDTNPTDALIDLLIYAGSSGFVVHK